MKIAITSNGNSLDSLLDNHFGRCASFIIYDTESQAIEIIPNPYKDLDENAGINALKIISSRNVRKIISGEFGLKIKDQLDAQKIQMIVLKNKTIRIQEIIDMLNHQN